MPSVWRLFAHSIWASEMEHHWKTFIKAHLKKLIIPAKYAETGEPVFPADRYRRWETQDLAIELADCTMMRDTYDTLVNPDFELALDTRSDEFLVIVSVVITVGSRFPGMKSPTSRSLAKGSFGESRMLNCLKCRSLIDDAEQLVPLDRSAGRVFRKQIGVRPAILERPGNTVKSSG
jgi:hypothetical protein